jgi:hypothetical protein
VVKLPLMIVVAFFSAAAILGWIALGTAVAWVNALDWAWAQSTDWEDCRLTSTPRQRMRCQRLAGQAGAGRRAYRQVAAAPVRRGGNAVPRLFCLAAAGHDAFRRLPGQAVS